MDTSVSALWEPVTRGEQRLEVRVDAYRGGLLIASDLPIADSGSSITVDGSSDVLRTLSLIVADPTLIPTSATDVLTPHGTELHVQQGFRYADGTTELIYTGIFRIDKPSTPFGGVVKVSAADRSRLIAEDQFTSAAQSVAGATLFAEIERLILAAYPDAVVMDEISNGTICPRTVWEPGTSRWKAVTELATAINAYVSVRPDGVFVVRPEPTIADAPALTLAIGEGGAVIDGEEEWDREGVYNAWTARGERADGTAPVQATVRDMDPGSPTYWDGDFGHRPASYSSPLLTTVPQCTAAATTKLAKSIVPARQVKVSCLQNPAVEYGDVASLIIPGALGSIEAPRTETHIVHAFTLPIGLGQMSITFRSSNDPG